MAVTFHLGKAKVDKNFIETIKASFKKQDIIKIKVLKTYSRNREEIKKTADLLAKELETENRRFISKIIGFTIILLKWKKHSTK